MSDNWIRSEFWKRAVKREEGAMRKFNQQQRALGMIERKLKNNGSSSKRAQIITSTLYRKCPPEFFTADKISEMEFGGQSFDEFLEQTLTNASFSEPPSDIAKRATTPSEWSFSDMSSTYSRSFSPSGRPLSSLPGSRTNSPKRRDGSDSSGGSGWTTFTPPRNARLSSLAHRKEKEPRASSWSPPRREINGRCTCPHCKGQMKHPEIKLAKLLHSNRPSSPLSSEQMMSQHASGDTGYRLWKRIQPGYNTSEKPASSHFETVSQSTYQSPGTTSSPQYGRSSRFPVGQRFTDQTIRDISVLSEEVRKR